MSSAPGAVTPTVVPFLSPQPSAQAPVSSGWPALVCPDDGASLRVGAEALSCPHGHVWTVQQGIPRMVPEPSNYADAFGLQWRTYRRTQLDSYTGVPLSRARARRCLGETLWAALHGAEAMQVLEAGCGAGRFTEVLLQTRARVTSVDLSTAVEANQENCAQDANHRVVQADVCRLPFAREQFDVVLCLGVVQHTPSPEETIQKLFDQVRPGGWLVLDHYTYNLSSLTKSASLVRRVLRRMPPAKALRWTERMVEVFLPLHRAVRRNRVAQALLSRISPVLSYYHVRDFPDELQRQWALLDTYDSLTDWYKHYRTRGQVRRALERTGATEIWCEYGGNGVEARCRRPTDS